jgi:flagellar motor switch protein FliM
MITELPNKRILVCTPSNSAVDEIVLRLGGKSKFKCYRGDLGKRIVRIGAMESDPIEQIKKHTLDYIVENY